MRHLRENAPKTRPKRDPEHLLQGMEREISRFCGKQPQKSALKGTLSTHRGGGGENMRNLWENAPKRDPEHSPRRGREKYHGFVVKIPKKAPEKGP